MVLEPHLIQPTFVLAVPRVFEKVYNSAEQKAGDGVSLRIFRWAAKVAITYSRALDTPAGPNPVLRTQHALADRLVHRKLRAALGGRAEFAVSGGAPLGERLGHFYRGIGVRVLEGYGLTETTAPTAVNRPGLTKVGTVGPAFPGTSVRVDDEGAIWVAVRIPDGMVAAHAKNYYLFPIYPMLFAAGAVAIAHWLANLR